MVWLFAHLHLNRPSDQLSPRTPAAIFEFDVRANASPTGSPNFRRDHSAFGETRLVRPYTSQWVFHCSQGTQVTYFHTLADSFSLLPFFFRFQSFVFNGLRTFSAKMGGVWGCA